MAKAFDGVITDQAIDDAVVFAATEICDYADQKSINPRVTLGLHCHLLRRESEYLLNRVSN